MNEEEKKAVKYLEKDLRKADMLEMTVHTDNESVRTALNLIQKQQAEKEQLKAELEKKDKLIKKQKEWIYELVSSEVSSCPSNELEENCTRADCTGCWIDYIENDILKNK